MAHSRTSALLIVIVVSAVAALFAQTTASTGSIVGMVRDPSDALVVGARIVNIQDVREAGSKQQRAGYL